MTATANTPNFFHCDFIEGAIADVGKEGRVVHQAINPAEPVVDRVGKRFHALLIGHVASDVHRLSARLPNLLHGFLSVENVGDPDLAAFSGDLFRVGFPDPAGRAGDDDDFVLELHGLALSQARVFWGVCLSIPTQFM